jgi:hypothetical protein
MPGLRYHILLSLALLLLSAGALPAQQGIVIDGTVSDGRTGELLAGTHVFIAGSMMGTTSDSEGRFRLTGVPEGAHRLYVSRLGYEPVLEDVFIFAGEHRTFAFAMKPVVYQLPPVVVTPGSSRRFERLFARFESNFLGETPSAREVSILNPHVLGFRTSWGRLFAEAQEPLLIENAALGYRIRYFMKDFMHSGLRTLYDGEPLFEPMQPSDDAQEERWEENRERAYRGSFRHFLQSLVRDEIAEEGFQIFRYMREEDLHRQSPRFPVRAASILFPGEEVGTYELRFYGILEVIYTREAEDPSYPEWAGDYRRRRSGWQRSWLRISIRPALIDGHGETLHPYSITQYGYFAFERVADQVPKEYRPPRETPAAHMRR